jgi:gamma-glutamyltranspeptidase / glutathione hydrolase
MLLRGHAPLPGQILRLPNLASTFRSVAEHGKDGFYKGRVAQAIVDLIQGEGGVMELEDLAKHRSTVVEPIKYTYEGDVTVYEVRFPVLQIILPVSPVVNVPIPKCPPNGQGITALMALGILEMIQEQGSVKPLLEMEHNSTEYLHTLIEAMRCAYHHTQS